MPPRYYNQGDVISPIGWKAREGRAAAKLADRHASLDIQKQLASLHRRDDARNTYNRAVDRRDKMAARVTSLESTLQTMEAAALQKGKVQDGQMRLTFDVAASRKALAVAEAEVISTKEAFVSAQQAMDEDHARQRASAAAEQDETAAEPVKAPIASKATAPKKVASR